MIRSILPPGSGLPIGFPEAVATAGRANLGGWTSSVLISFVAATALSWVPMTPSVGRTVTRACVVSWMTVSTLGWMMAVARSSPGQDLLKRVTQVVMAIGLCAMVAAPMMTSDLWCYVGYARLAAAGGNPYATQLPGGLLEELGPTRCGTSTAYGPAWTYGTALLDRFVAPFGLTAELIAFKAVFLVGWIAMVLAVAWLLRNRDVTTRGVGLAAIAVAPISAFELVSEAHNDVVMIALAMGWLVLRARNSWLGPIPLALSVLVKYVTAPFLIVSVVDAWRRQRYRELACALFALLTISIVAGLFWRDDAFANFAAHNANWRWLSAPFAIELAVKNVAPFSWVAPTVWAWRALLMLAVAWYVRAWHVTRDHDLGLYRVLAAGMLALILSADYLWPWYLVWALPFVILAEDRMLSAVAWPCFVVIPIAQVCWAGGIRDLGYRTEIVLSLLGLILVGWLAQAWLALRGPSATHR